MYTLEQFHWVPVVYPVLGFMDGGASTDIVKCESAVGVLFQITKGIGAAGTSLVTIQACGTVGPVGTAAVAFMHRVSTTPDIWGAWIQDLAAGFTTDAGSNQMYQVFVPAANLAAVGYAYVRLTWAQAVAGQITGCINAAVVQPRYQPVPATLLT